MKVRLRYRTATAILCVRVAQIKIIIIRLIFSSTHERESASDVKRRRRDERGHETVATLSLQNNCAIKLARYRELYQKS